jgi:Putative zinc-finger
MDHDLAVRQKMTERYLLEELDPAAREEFEEHFFSCTACAFDVRAGEMFVEQSKISLAERPVEDSARQPSAVVVKPERLSWLRPAFVVPAMALLLAVMGYQNLVTYPRLMQKLNTPGVLPFASVNIGTYGSRGPEIKVRQGEDFLIFVRIPPEGEYVSYTADLYNPTGRLEWSVTIPMTQAQDQWSIHVPAAYRPAGGYSLAVHGVDARGESTELGRASFELQIEK